MKYNKLNLQMTPSFTYLIFKLTCIHAVED